MTESLDSLITTVSLLNIVGILLNILPLIISIITLVLVIKIYKRK